MRPQLENIAVKTLWFEALEGKVVHIKCRSISDAVAAFTAIRQWATKLEYVFRAYESTRVIRPHNSPGWIAVHMSKIHAERTVEWARVVC